MYLHWSCRVVTPPTQDAIDLAAMKLYLRVDGNYEDQTIQSLIGAAKEYVEGQTGRAMVQTGYRFMLDRFPLTPGLEYQAGMPAIPVPPVTNRWPLDPSAWALMVPRSPLISVQSIQYIDANGDTQTMSPSIYQVDSDSEPARIIPVQGQQWPATQFGPGAVTILFNAGYASPDQVPPAMAQAIRMLVAHWYVNREQVIDGRFGPTPNGVDALCAQARVMWEW